MNKILKEVDEILYDLDISYDDDFSYDDLVFYDGADTYPEPSLLGTDTTGDAKSRKKMFVGGGRRRKRENLLYFNVQYDSKLFKINDEEIEEHNTPNNQFKLKGEYLVPKVKTIAHGLQEIPQIKVNVEEIFHTTQQLSDEQLIQSCILENIESKNNSTLPIIKGKVFSVISEQMKTI